MPHPRIHDPQTVYDYLWRYHQEHGVAPTLREIADGCGIGSINTVTLILHRLHRQKLIRRIPNISRGIILVENPTAMD